MNKLSFPPQSFDLIWSEGAAYIMGFEKALVAWKRLLKPSGYLAVSELIWLQPNPPTEVAEFFGREYPAMTSVENIVATLQASGYEPRGHVTLPAAAWWTSYYTPLEANLPSLKARYESDEEALSIIEMTACEIDMRRRFGNWYGYEFLIGRSI
jgi:SAM-dependent methyltransferase